MKIEELKKFWEMKIELPPPVFCPKWNHYINIVGCEQFFKLLELMRNDRHTCITPLHYLIKADAFKLFMLGNTAYDAFGLFHIPLSTAFDYYKLYLRICQNR